MEKIASFTVNHLKLKKGLYVSRKDQKDGVVLTTFDVRLTEPNVEEPISNPALHTIEHLGATFLRNGKLKSEVVYFGPMGCRTGFYLILFGDRTPEEIYSTIIETCDFIIDFNGEIPGYSPIECGNYTEHDLKEAKIAVERYRNYLRINKNFQYQD